MFLIILLLWKVREPHCGGGLEQPAAADPLFEVEQQA